MTPGSPVSLLSLMFVTCVEEENQLRERAEFSGSELKLGFEGESGMAKALSNLDQDVARSMR